MTVYMYDGINSLAPGIAREFPNATRVAGYDNGRYAWTQADWDLFPHADHIHISVTADANLGDVLDVETGALKTWIGVGGSPESVIRAVRYDLPLMLAIIGGDPKRFRPYVDLYLRAYAQLGKPAREIGVHSPGYVADSDQQAREELYPDYKRMRDRIGGERGWPPMAPEEFTREIEHGSLYVGAPETVARKIAATAKALGISRFDLKYSAGALSHDKLMRGIELYGRKVVPLVREILAKRAPIGIEARALHWSSYFRIHHRCASKLRVGRVFIAGDAAHIHSPFGGQGMNIGLGI